MRSKLSVAEKSVREALNEVPMPADVEADTLYDFEGSFVLDIKGRLLAADNIKAVADAGDLLGGLNDLTLHATERVVYTRPDGKAMV